MTSVSSNQPPTESRLLALDERTRPLQIRSRRMQVGLSGVLVGFIIFMVGAKPGFFGLDRSPVIGFVQIAVFLIGLAIMCLGGYLNLMALWQKTPPSIAADIGVRLVATGYVIAVFSGMADIFGFGSHPLPGVPFFGPLQALGMILGEIMIGLGFILLLPWQRLLKLK